MHKAEPTLPITFPVAGLPPVLYSTLPFARQLTRDVTTSEPKGQLPVVVLVVTVVPTGAAGRVCHPPVDGGGCVAGVCRLCCHPPDEVFVELLPQEFEELPPQLALFKLD